MNIDQMSASKPDQSRAGYRDERADGHMYSSAAQNETSAPMNSNNNNNSGMADSNDKPKKRIRRTAGEINRRFVCFCGKAYGSEGSLN